MKRSAYNTQTDILQNPLFIMFGSLLKLEWIFGGIATSVKHPCFLLPYVYQPTIYEIEQIRCKMSNTCYFIKRNKNDDQGNPDKKLNGWYFALYEGPAFIESFGRFNTQAIMQGYARNHYPITDIVMLDTGMEGPEFDSLIETAVTSAKVPFFAADHAAVAQLDARRISRIRDQKQADMQEFIPLWLSLFGQGERGAKTVKQLAAAANRHRSLLDFFASRFLADWRLNTVKLSHWLLRHRDTSVDGRHIERTGWNGYYQTHIWSVVPVGGVYPKARVTPFERLLTAWADNLGRDDVGTYNLTEVILAAAQFPDLVYALQQTKANTPDDLESFLLTYKRRKVNDLRIAPVENGRWTVTWDPPKVTDFPFPSDTFPDYSLLDAVAGSKG